MEHISAHKLNDVWLKSAVIGGIWASFEIVIGSFLHNLRIPFSGTILASFSVFMLTAFMQLWKDPGIIWRAGIICALMKSLSPSAVILGPMVGIISEAVLIWIFLWLFGPNLLGYITGGIAAVSSALLHKVGSLLLIYGFDLLKIAEGLYHYLVKVSGFDNISVHLLLIIILGVYTGLGSLAAVMGYRTGKKILKHPTDAKSTIIFHSQPKNELFLRYIRRPKSVAFLLVHLVAIFSCLWLLNNSPFFLAFSISTIYFLVCLLWYHGQFRFFKKVGFWLQLFLITLIASFIIEGHTSGNYFSQQGLMIGIKMNIRAIIIMIGFAAISVELRNPLIRLFLYSKGFARLYQSLNLAFSALPDIISSLPNYKEIIRGRTLYISYLFEASRILLEKFEDDLKNLSDVIILRGEIGQGKTSYVSHLVKVLKANGIRFYGITAPGVMEEGVKIGYSLQDISTGDQYQLSSLTRKEEDWIPFRRFYFNPEALRKGMDILLGNGMEESELVVIDEVGPLELNDSGWAPAIERLIQNKNLLHLWVVRNTYAELIARKWNLGNVYTINIASQPVEMTFELIDKILHAKHNGGIQINPNST